MHWLWSQHGWVQTVLQLLVVYPWAEVLNLLVFRGYILVVPVLTEKLRELGWIEITQENMLLHLYLTQ